MRTTDALLKGEVDLVISPQPPPGFFSELLMCVRLVAVAHVNHPLHQSRSLLTRKDLNSHRHIVVRDSGVQRDRRSVSVEVNQRWTLSQLSTSIQAVMMGFGFAWLPEGFISDELTSGVLKPLRMKGGTIDVPLYITVVDPDSIGPAAQHLLNIIRETVFAGI